MGGLWEKHAAMRRVAMQKHQGLGRKMMRMNDRGGGGQDLSIAKLQTWKTSRFRGARVKCGERGQATTGAAATDPIQSAKPWL
jgi:hypothetical protein